MIISHKHRYVFMELPHTGTRAINRELMEMYEGERILSHHSNLYDFLRVASKDESSYFKFSAIRNPLDLTVSQFYKHKALSADRESDAERRQGRRRKGSRLQGMFFERRRRQQLAYVADSDTSFADYFRKFYRFPYDSWASVCHDKCDFVIRFESLQQDFSSVLSKLGIQQVRELPHQGRTRNRRGHYSSFYTDGIQDRAVHVFGPFMARWGYDFPEAWGAVSPSALSHFQYALLSRFRHPYWRYVRPYL